MGILEKHNRYSCVTVGVKNPIRYRGYYYDVETGLYYLQSRYYDPQTGRFINADDTDYLGADGSFASYNLFAYCSNNPVMNVDPSGCFSLGKHWWNKVNTIANTIDIIIILIPALCVLKNFLRAGKIAAAFAKTAAKMSRKKLRSAFVKMGLKLAKATGWCVLSTIGGKIFDIISTITGLTIGKIIANAIDKLDGKKDGYIYA